MSGYTIDMLNAIKAAYAEGTKVFRYQDKWLEYRSLDEMQRIIKKLERELGVTPTNKSSRVFATFNDGN